MVYKPHIPADGRSLRLMSAGMWARCGAQPRAGGAAHTVETGTRVTSAEGTKCSGAAGADLGRLTRA